MLPDLPKGAHVFVDETKARGFLLVGVAIAASDLQAARRRLRALVVSGRHRVHFKKLSDSQRGEVLRAVRALPIRVIVVSSRQHDQVEARAAAMACLAACVRRSGAGRLVVERDDSFEAADRAAVARVWPAGDVRHLAGVEEPLLWVSDAIAWCVQRRGEWSRRINDLIDIALDAENENGPG